MGTMECLLCFEAWLEQFTFGDGNNTTGEADKAEAAIASLLRLIVKYQNFMRSSTLSALSVCLVHPVATMRPVLRSIAKRMQNVQASVHRRI